MTTMQKVIKYAALAFALFLALSIIGGIVGGVALLGGFIDSDTTTDDLKTYEIDPSSEIMFLDIEIGAADFTIKEADAFKVESNLKNLTVEENNGTLTIKEKTSFGRYDGAQLTLYIPMDKGFRKADIVTGAGRFTADSLIANELTLVLGAGEVYLKELGAPSSAHVVGGAGKLTIAGGTLCNLELEMGVGQLNLTATLYGENELDLGVGESNITLIGPEENYSVDIEKGLGGITVDGKGVSDYGRVGNGQGSLDIDGGVGAIHLNFKEA
ncbi:MAG: DUF4097 family beta strand repeat protein [Clostridia bacterium]|nr:DUF4097 family beta strand repeat protein [Clostridia bacterium]